MEYEIDLAAAAKRHFSDGETLLKAKSPQHAGYHFGFAAECALKSQLYPRGIPRGESHRTDPLWAHFPQLRTALVRDGRGRFPHKLYEVIAHGAFMQHWNTAIRYAPNRSVTSERAEGWRDQADQVFGLIFF